MKTYFLYASDMDAVKIGKSTDPRRRVAALRGSVPFSVELVGVINGDKETELHRRFNPERIGGEWFRLSCRISRFILTELERDIPSACNRDRKPAGLVLDPVASKESQDRKSSYQDFVKAIQVVRAFKLTCTRCGHQWTPASAEHPKRCPSKECKSPNWNRSDVRAYTRS